MMKSYYSSFILDICRFTLVNSPTENLSAENVINGITPEATLPLSLHGSSIRVSLSSLLNFNYTQDCRSFEFAGLLNKSFSNHCHYREERQQIYKWHMTLLRTPKILVNSLIALCIGFSTARLFVIDFDMCSFSIRL